MDDMAFGFLVKIVTQGLLATTVDSVADTMFTKTWLVHLLNDYVNFV